MQTSNSIIERHVSHEFTFDQKSFPTNWQTISRILGIFGFSGNIHENFRIENHHFKFCVGKPLGGKSPKVSRVFSTDFLVNMEHFDIFFIILLKSQPCCMDHVRKTRFINLELNAQTTGYNEFMKNLWWRGLNTSVS